MRVLNELIKLVGGVQVPAGAGAGKVLTSDASGNGTWAVPPLQPRKTATFTTAALANGAASGSVTVVVDKADLVYVLQTDRAARVRAYGTAADLAADATRPVGTDPGPSSGVQLDVVTTAGLLIVHLAPAVELVNLDTVTAAAFYFNVQNLSGGTSTVTVTLTCRQEE